MEVGDWSRQARVLFRRSSLPPSMHAMFIEVCLEIEQLVFQICCGPEQREIQILASNGADPWALYKDKRELCYEDVKVSFCTKR
jgi:hypothetical protein